MFRYRFFRFLLAGGVAALMNMGSRYLLSFWLPYSAAIVLAFFVGLSCGFLLSRQFVFDPTSRSRGSQLGWFVAINLAALLQVWAVSLLLAEWVLPALGVDTYRYDLAHVIGVLTPVATSYFAHKHLTFRQV